MNYNTDFQNNNAELQEILATIKELPEANSGGIDTSDATAQAKHIVAPETAYVNGEKVTGTVKTAYGGISAEVTPEVAAGMPYVAMYKFIGEPTYISPDTGGNIQLRAPFEAFGNVMPEDVPVGKTFTSAAGFLVEGTKTESSGDVEQDPRELYQRVEYITSDGEAYLLTDFIADNTCGVEMVVSFPYFADHTGMGSRNDSGSTRFFAPYAYSSSIWYAGFNGNVKISASTKVETVYRCQVNFLNSRLTTVYDEAGTLKGSTAISDTLTAQSYPICIFTQNYEGVPRTPRIFPLYSTRCSKGNDVVREYIPCYRKADGVIGAYEKFTKTFLTNAGTGGFTKGPDIDW